MEHTWRDHSHGQMSSTLVKEQFRSGKSWLHDVIQQRQYGWVYREHWYNEDESEKGLWVAEIPSVGENEVEVIGIYETKEAAQAAVMDANNPSYSCVYI